MVVDDDTFVFVDRLKSYLSTLTNEDALALGRGAAGGAGFIFNKLAAMRLLMPAAQYADVGWISGTWRPYQADNSSEISRLHWDPESKKWREPSLLDTCIARQMGGPNCFYHSDWMIETCLQCAELGMIPIMESYSCLECS